MGRDPKNPPATGEKRTPEKKEKSLEKALDDSFPASDPPAVTSPTRSITGDDEVVNKPPPTDDAENPDEGMQKGQGRRKDR